MYATKPTTISFRPSVAQEIAENHKDSTRNNPVTLLFGGLTAIVSRAAVEIMPVSILDCGLGHIATIRTDQNQEILFVGALGRWTWVTRNPTREQPQFNPDGVFMSILLPVLAFRAVAHSPLTVAGLCAHNWW